MAHLQDKEAKSLSRNPENNMEGMFVCFFISDY